MKILFTSITDSGILRVRSELIMKLLQHKHKVYVVTPQETDYIKLIDLGCEFVPIYIQAHGTNPVKDVGVYSQYIKILKRIKPDIVLTFTTKPNIYGGMACRRLHIPVVMNITGMGNALGKKGVLQSLLVRMYKIACNGDNIKRIFFQNDNSKEFFTMHGIGNPSVFYRIPGSGINLEKFPLQPFPKGDTLDFLFVARVLKEKGIEQYIDAARFIRKKYPNTVFHVLGACDKAYQDILSHETKSGVIQYHGRVNNIAEYQKLSQCTIQPSYYPEGMSNVILEAAASGRPVITTDHPGCREGVDNGVTGYIIPIKDSIALIHAVERFMQLSYEEKVAMGLAGRRKMEKEFDRVIVTDAYMDSITT